MKIMNFKDIHELSNYMFDKYDDGLCVVASLFFDDAADLMKDIICNHHDIAVGYLNISNEEFDCYGKEYYVCLDDGELSVEPAFVNNRYLITGADIMLLDGDASSSIIGVTGYDKCVEISIGEDNTDIELRHEEASKDSDKSVITIHIDTDKLSKEFLNYLKEDFSDLIF